MGTPGYAAPEQYGLGQTDARSDVYSLGVVMHNLLTKHDPSLNPFNFTPVRQLNPAVSPQVEAVVIAQLRANPAERYQSVLEMRAALRGSTLPEGLAAPTPALGRDGHGGGAGFLPPRRAIPGRAHARRGIPPAGHCRAYAAAAPAPTFPGPAAQGDAGLGKAGGLLARFCVWWWP